MNIKIVNDDPDIEMKSRGRFTDLYQEGRRKLTIYIWMLWFVSALGYYGVVLMSTELLNSSKDYCGHYESPPRQHTLSDLLKKNSSNEESCSLQCEYVNNLTF